ncbi:O-antigen ligase family protein [Cryptosporangium sp. NPDC048952]|uniref:O-antigen ligase family protein n=1 Tax=Cryptosporangium sp. NPDC048952 TaxID=3363961 RepID=UPI003710A66B
MGAGLIGIAAATSTWGALHLGPVQPVDGFLAAGAALVLLDALVARVRMPSLLPRWALIGTWAILFITASSVLLPPSPGFVSRRLVVDTSFVTGNGDLTPVWLKGVQWLVAASVLIVVVRLIALRSPHRVQWISSMWMLGACVTAVIAISDFVGASTVSTILMGYENIEGRQSGLSSHPNNLGIACAMAVPIAVFLAASRRMTGLIAVALLVSGAVVSGSRAAQVAIVLVLLASVTMRSLGRRMLPWFAGGAVAFVFVVAFIRPSWIPSLTSLFRFSASNSNASESDAGRAELARQAFADFGESPVHGIGLDYIVTAHSIYLQVFAAGGMLLGVGMLVYLIGALSTGLRLARESSSLAFFLMLSHVAWLGSGAVSNQLTDRYLYFPVACLAGLELVRGLKVDQSS